MECILSLIRWSNTQELGRYKMTEKNKSANGKKMVLKKVGKVLQGLPTSDGAGVNLTRALGQPGLKHIDPFLMLDEIRSDDASDYIAGFPPHPHKGFETLTYMVQGSMEHNDSTGGKGIISSGGVQYMTAGKGIIHSETPQQDSGLMFGFQLWINLPANQKLQAAKYVDIPASQIERLETQGVSISVIAGQLNATLHQESKVQSDEPKFEETVLISNVGPVIRNDIEMQMYDIRLKKSELEANAQELELYFDQQSQGFVYVYQGDLTLNGHEVHSKQIAKLEASNLQNDNLATQAEGLNGKREGLGGKESIVISALASRDRATVVNRTVAEGLDNSQEGEVGLLLLMANPINEPIVQYGPFVMNTMAEIDQAIRDYQTGNFV